MLASTRSSSPSRLQHGLLLQVPDVDRVTAAAILAVIGTDLEALATTQRLAASAGVAPRQLRSRRQPEGSCDTPR